MDYSTMEKYGFIGILPRKKRYHTDKDAQTVKAAILQNQDFIQYALTATGADYLNQILPRLVYFIIECNAAFYEYSA